MQTQKIHSQADELKNWRSRSVVTSACFPDNFSAFFSFFFRWGKPQTTWFVLSFFFTLTFSFFKDYNKKRQRYHLPFFLSFFLSFFLFSFISFFLFHFNFFFFIELQRKILEITPSILSFFFFHSFLNSMYTDTQIYTQKATLVFYIIRRLPLNYFYVWFSSLYSHISLVCFLWLMAYQSSWVI